MQVIVCGAGQVGLTIARHLAAENNGVTVVDSRRNLIQKIGDTEDFSAIVGFASHPDVLERAGAEDCDMIIAVTYSDEVNMIACKIAHALFDVPIKIARVRDQILSRPAMVAAVQPRAHADRRHHLARDRGGARDHASACACRAPST